MQKTIASFSMILLGFFIVSCSGNRQTSNTDIRIKKDTLAYSYKTIKERLPDCSGKPDSECVIVQIKYPVFIAQDLLTDSLREFVIRYREVQTASSLDEFAKKYVEYYIAFIKKYKKYINKPYSAVVNPEHVRLSIDIIKQDASLVCIRINDDSYKHYPLDEFDRKRFTFTYFINWDIKKNKSIHLKDIFINSYQKKLNKTAEVIFRRNEGLSHTTSLLSRNENGRGYYMFNNGVFTVYDSFLITPDGLKFWYNPFDIKPYDAGTTELFIPYSQIRSLLRPNTVVSQYHK